jgi:hypothetical protein
LYWRSTPLVALVPFAGGEDEEEFDSELAGADDSGAGVELVIGDGEGGEGIAGEVILSRTSGISAASGVGVEGSIGSRYGSASP